MRNLKNEETLLINGGNGGKTATGAKIKCPKGTAPHLGDHGDKKGPHCDLISELPTVSNKKGK